MSLQIKNLAKRIAPCRHNQPSYTTPCVIRSQRGGFILAYRKTFYQCVKSTSNKIDDLYNLHCGFRRPGDRKCEIKSKGKAIIRNFKFIRFIIEPEDCSFIRQTAAMKRYGKHTKSQVELQKAVIGDLDKLSTIAAVQHHKKSVPSEVNGLRKRKSLYRSVLYHAQKKRKKKSYS